MRLSSISLIASALAATAGNTIAAPGLLYARSLQQGILFGRDTDSVDLFTRNPPDPEHTRQPDDGWYHPVGASPALPPGLLVDITKDHVPQLPLTDPGHHQHYPHLQDHVPPGPQPPVEHTRDYRQNVHVPFHSPPNHRHAEPRHQPSSHLAPLRQRHAKPRHRPSSHLAPLRQLLPAPLPQHPQQPALHHSLNPQHPSSHVPPQPLVDPTRNYWRNVHGPSQASPNHEQSGPCLQYPLADLGHNRHSPQAHVRAEPRHQPPPPSAPLQLLPAPPNHAEAPNVSERHKHFAHEHRIAGRSLFITQAVAQYAAVKIPGKAKHYEKWAGSLGTDSDKHFVKQRKLLGGERVSNWKGDVARSAEIGQDRASKDVKTLWNAIEREHREIKERRDAKEKEFEQKLNEHERQWNLWNPGQPYPGHPEQHQ